MKDIIKFLASVLLFGLQMLVVMAALVVVMGAFVALGYFGMAVLELLFWDARPATFQL